MDGPLFARPTVSGCNFLEQYIHCVAYFRQVLVWAENQGNHQNFEKSLLSYKLSLISIGMKQFFFFLKKKIQNGQLKRSLFSCKMAKVTWLARMGQNFDQAKCDNTF